MSELLISEEQFDEQFNLVQNHIVDDAAFGGCMFETYDEELIYIREMRANPETKGKVWTIITGEDDSLFYSSGYHIVNRLGYLITEESVDPDTCITVEIETN